MRLGTCDRLSSVTNSSQRISAIYVRVSGSRGGLDSKGNHRTRKGL